VTIFLARMLGTRKYVAMNTGRKKKRNETEEKTMRRPGPDRGGP
jgi:hypothetical protein